MDTVIQVRRPWNKGLIVDRNARSFQDRFGQSAFGWRCRLLPGTSLKVEDVSSGRLVRDCGVVIQRKTGRPVQFEITEVTRQSVERLLASQPSADGYLFRSRTRGRPHISARQYARIVHRWIGNIGLDDRGLALTRCVEPR